MGLLALLLCSVAALPQAPAPAASAKKPLVQHPEVVLAPEPDPVPLASFGLGDGGVEPRPAPGHLQWTKSGCRTPGGVQVECRAVGVKLTFRSGCELLVAADGHLHLRTGEVAGPFPSGLELRLGDDTLVRIVLAQGQRERVRDVFVVVGERVLQPWRRGGPATEVVRPGHWAGVRVACCGDGGDLFRAIAIGPLVVLDRLLVAQERALLSPKERLVVLTDPLVRSLAVMQRQHRQPDAAVRQAVTAVAAVADRGDQIFPAGAALLRAEPDALRWGLRGGFELQLDLDGPQAPRLALFQGQATRPMVEWTLRGSPAAFLTNPHDDQPGAPRWHGNGTRMPSIAEDLQARAELFEAVHALQVVRRLRR